ncbi:MAG: (2Fe-2S) ferredoxin domain-containing protein [Erysipelotrichaceae bacterium]|jgi:NADP-reducing hydrogenase subunit HndB|nr:(2Fe-2S) ferredoxin domain-containing protein [Erysipelotrichaceae bacterium]
MKSLEDLKKLRESAKRKIDMRQGEADYRIVVGMATCGIAAGARPVLNALLEELDKNHYPAVVTQTGCIGMCTLEPIVEVFDKQGEKTTYVLVNPEKAREIIHSHVGKGEVLQKYTIAATGK